MKDALNAATCLEAVYKERGNMPVSYDDQGRRKVKYASSAESISREQRNTRCLYTS